MKTALRIAVIALLVPLAMTATTGAAGAAGIEGLWQGTLQGMLHLVVHIARTPAGGLTGTMDSPDQGAMGLPIDTMEFTGDSLHFSMKQIGGEFAGKMTASGDRLSGSWRQGGQSMAFEMTHVEKATMPRRPQEPLRPFPYDTAAVAFDNAKAGIRLAGTLTFPRGAGPFPCALLITGSGPEDRDEAVFGHRPFLVLADHLTRQGIAVLRLDDRGVGGSTGQYSRATSEDFASDVRAGIEFLKTRPEVDPKRIGLIGHSEGGLIAPMVAVGSKDVAFVVLMAGPGIPGDSTMMLQSAAIRGSIGVTDAALAREMAVNRRMYAAMRQGDSLGVVREVRELVRLQLAGISEANRRAAGDPDSIAAAATRQMFTPWMKFFAVYDPRPTLQRLRCPVLAINGGKDLQVLPKENLDAIQTAFKTGGVPHYTVKELPGLNHMFQTCTTCTMGEYIQLEETMSPVALETISQWILTSTTTVR